MEEFLLSRNVSLENITKMKEDGIDETVILQMSSEDLQKYIPKYGDCLALFSFLKQQKQMEAGCAPSSSTYKKMTLRDRLAAKLNSKINQEHDRRSLPQTVNKNAKKGTKKVEVGWLHQYSEDCEPRQVRSQNGGGTRSIDIEVDEDMSDLLRKAQTLFFPDGQSKKGSVSEFKFWISDQTQVKLANDVTVREVCNSAKFKRLRFYMVTDVAASIPIRNETDSKTPDQSQNTQTEADDIQLISDNIISSHSDDSELESVEFFVDPFVYQSPTYLSDDSLPTLDIIRESYIPEIVHEDSQVGPVGTGVNKLHIHRTLIQEELVACFKAPEIVDQSLSFSFINEFGHDTDGVSRDAYSGFWDSFYQRNTDGEAYRIPLLVNEYSLEEWGAIGRILLKGFTDHRYLPIHLAPVFMIAIIHGEESVTPELITNSFMLYLAPSEKDIIQAAQHGLPYETDELLGILDRFQCHKIPTPEDLDALIVQIGHKTLIQEPKYALDAIANIARAPLQLLLPDIESILNMYNTLEPSIAKVISLIKENSSLGYLYRFIRGRNICQLSKLLRLMTGADVVSVEKIDVLFVIRHGKGRVPTFHTCGPSLELPSTYTSYPDFRNEWEHILDDKESFGMDIA